MVLIHSLLVFSYSHPLSVGRVLFIARKFKVEEEKTGCHFARQKTEPRSEPSLDLSSPSFLFSLSATLFASGRHGDMTKMN